ncbi:hypothetical protein VI817_004159 [Penicillium citrinum]|nr:hypothetical protein VI817_004159 [Penicillium citrinum]
MSVGAEVISGSYGAPGMDGKEVKVKKNEERVENEGSGRDKKSVLSSSGRRQKCLCQPGQLCSVT